MFSINLFGSIKKSLINTISGKKSKRKKSKRGKQQVMSRNKIVAKGKKGKKNKKSKKSNKQVKRASSKSALLLTKSKGKIRKMRGELVRNYQRSLGNN